MSTQKELFSLRSNIRLLSVSIYSVLYFVQLCEELPECLSLCLTLIHCCVNTNLSLTNLMHQSSVPMEGQSP